MTHHKGEHKAHTAKYGSIHLQMQPSFAAVQIAVGDVFSGPLARAHQVGWFHLLLAYKPARTQKCNLPLTAKHRTLLETLAATSSGTNLCPPFCTSFHRPNRGYPITNKRTNNNNKTKRKMLSLTILPFPSARCSNGFCSIFEPKFLSVEKIHLFEHGTVQYGVVKQASKRVSRCSSLASKVRKLGPVIFPSVYDLCAPDAAHIHTPPLGRTGGTRTLSNSQAHTLTLSLTHTHIHGHSKAGQPALVPWHFRHGTQYTAYLHHILRGPKKAANGSSRMFRRSFDGAPAQQHKPRAASHSTALSLPARPKNAVKTVL